MQIGLLRIEQPHPWIEPVLQTITSTRIRKIIFDTDLPSRPDCINSYIDSYSWSALDAIFLRMANAICPTEGRLELVFNALDARDHSDFNPVYPGLFLEGCRTKAMVRFERTQS